MRRGLLAWGFGLLCLPLVGCASMLDMGAGPCPKGGPEYGHIYGGVRAHAANVTSSKTPGEAANSLCLLALDGPLCLIADTLLLPTTIARTIHRMRKEQKTSESKSDIRPADYLEKPPPTASVLNPPYVNPAIGSP